MTRQRIKGPMPKPDNDRRTAARRTALILALVAAGVYVAFIMSGVVGR
jgi:hypothetical protein